MQVAIAPQTSTSSVAYVTELSGWTRIFDPTINMVVHQRSASTTQAEAAQRLAAQAFRAIQVVVDPEKTRTSHLTELLFGEEPIARDVLELAKALADLVGASAIGARVAQMRAPMCPAFHVDRVLVRVVVAYFGPGSQWLEERHVDRSALGARQSVGAQVLREGATISQVPTFHVALMKGELWPNNAGRGLVHRSPPPHGSTRILATLDALE